jgi:hypothetical protein
MARSIFQFFLVFSVINLALIIFGGWVTLSSAGEKSNTFTGAWAANGTQTIVDFGENRHVALFNLTGHVNLKDEVGTKKDYWADCIGLADSATGSDIRCVWRSMDGQEIYIVLQTDQITPEKVVSGKIAGGTGAAKGITGSLKFDWTSLSMHEGNKRTAISGYTNNLTGYYKLP